MTELFAGPSYHFRVDRLQKGGNNVKDLLPQKCNRYPLELLNLANTYDGAILDKKKKKKKKKRNISDKGSITQTIISACKNIKKQIKTVYKFLRIGLQQRAFSCDMRKYSYLYDDMLSLLRSHFGSLNCQTSGNLPAFAWTLTWSMVELFWIQNNAERFYYTKILARTFSKSSANKKS